MALDSVIVWTDESLSDRMFTLTRRLLQWTQQPTWKSPPPRLGMTGGLGSDPCSVCRASVFTPCLCCHTPLSNPPLSPSPALAEVGGEAPPITATCKQRAFLLWRCPPDAGGRMMMEGSSIQADVSVRRMDRMLGAVNTDMGGRYL